MNFTIKRTRKERHLAETLHFSGNDENSERKYHLQICTEHIQTAGSITTY